MTYRAVFFTAEHARSATQRLTTDGFTVQLLQRDRPRGGAEWVVLTDAPEIVLELLVERYDGWLET